MAPTSCTRRAILRRTGATLATVTTAGCLSDAASTETVIEMTDEFTFDPTTATIESGQTVTWRNTDAVDHTVTAYEDRIPVEAAYFASGGFGSESEARDRVTEGLVAAGEEYEHTFEQPGTYEYYCVPHESADMVGTIRVR